MKAAKTSDKRGGAEGLFFFLIIGRKHLMLFCRVGELVNDGTKGKKSFSLHHKSISLTGGGFFPRSSMVTEAIFGSGR